MEDNTRENRQTAKTRQIRKRKITDLIPWIGGLFWLIVLLWLMLPHGGEQPPMEDYLLSRAPAGLQLKGFRVRQETHYTDGRFTYMDLHAIRGWSLEGGSDTHLLVDVSVELVTKKAKPAQEATTLEDLSLKTDVAWVQIQAATGIYSFKTRNIDLLGNVQVYGYSLKGELTEWITTERLFYDWQAGAVRSISPATYQGQSFQTAQPYRCFVEADLNLSEISIRDLEALDESFKTPFTNPELRPPYSPPEALRFLEEKPM